jgi:5-oxoprolinase (ATP-hydrolysing) subunit A
VDLNADVGESFGAYRIGHDETLLPTITSASIAAGCHGGDPSVIRRTIRLARTHDVRVGAHPGFPDLAGFGRREMHLAPREVEDLVLSQIATVAGIARAEGVGLQHVKPHGALYNMAARDESLAAAIVRAITAFDRKLVLFAPPGSAMHRAAEAAGVTVAREAFADRGYLADGSLAPRGTAGAVIDDPDAALTRVLRMLQHHEVAAADGRIIPIDPDTVCIHSDTPGADRLAAALRTGLEKRGVAVTAQGLGLRA